MKKITEARNGLKKTLLEHKRIMKRYAQDMRFLDSEFRKRFSKSSRSIHRWEKLIQKLTPKGN